MENMFFVFKKEFIWYWVGFIFVKMENLVWFRGYIYDYWELSNGKIVFLVGVRLDFFYFVLGFGLVGGWRGWLKNLEEGRCVWIWDVGKFILFWRFRLYCMFRFGWVRWEDVFRFVLLKCWGRVKW